MKINKNVEEVLSNQVNAEFWSANMYLSMSSWFMEKGLKGFANWMRVQYQEENAHALKIFDFILERQGSVKLMALDAVPTDWKSILDVMEETYKHECKVTAMIYNCIDVAEKDKDRATVSMLQWYVDEQIEEEANVDELIGQLKLIGEDGQGLYHLDKELATRVFVDPTKPAAN